MKCGLPIRSAWSLPIALSAVGVAFAMGLLGFAGRPSANFDLSRHSVPLDLIVSGGPGRDGIPAILKPAFVSLQEATFLKDEDRILGLSHGREAKAYPIKVLNWHEIVNDAIGGRAVVVTYCPLCGSGIAFESVVQERVYTFGVSGLLYQSDLLMYDHQTESLWSQIAMEAIAGPVTGAKLAPVFLEHTTWGEWKAEHPGTLVLSTATGHVRNYERDPYLGYAERSDLMFPTNRVDRRFHPKEWVLGIEIKGAFKAYPFTELKKVKAPFSDAVNGRTIQIHFNPRAQTASVRDTDGKPLPSVTAFWFAWYAFHPDTQVFTAD